MCVRVYADSQSSINGTDCVSTINVHVPFGVYQGLYSRIVLPWQVLTRLLAVQLQRKPDCCVFQYD